MLFLSLSLRALHTYVSLALSLFPSYSRSRVFRSFSLSLSLSLSLAYLLFARDEHVCDVYVCIRVRGKAAVGSQDSLLPSARTGTRV